jgi:hypothetical protein
MVIGAGAFRLKVMVRVGCCSIQICGDNERVVDMIGCVVLAMMECCLLLVSARDLQHGVSTEVQD